MKTIPTPRLFLALTAGVALAACQDATAPDALDEELLPEVAAVAADAVVEEVGLMIQPFAFATGAAARAPWGHGGGPGQPGGHHGLGKELSGTRSVTFFDEAGAEQESYDPLTTASLRAVVEVAGEVERPGWSGSVRRARELTVSGLLGQETTRIFNGTGEEEVRRVRTRGQAVRTFELVGSSTRTDVVVPVPGSESPWPLSGTVRRTMTVTATGGPGGDRTRTVDVLITFDGDATATAVMDGETFEIDLSARFGGDPIHSGFGRRPGG